MQLVIKMIGEMMSVLNVIEPISSMESVPQKWSMLPTVDIICTCRGQRSDSAGIAVRI